MNGDYNAGLSKEVLLTLDFKEKYSLRGWQSILLHENIRKWQVVPLCYWANACPASNKMLRRSK
jgi:hypothetical protein